MCIYAWLRYTLRYVDVVAVHDVVISPCIFVLISTLEKANCRDGPKLQQRNMRTADPEAEITFRSFEHLTSPD
jgi:hypothetical protein